MLTGASHVHARVQALLLKASVAPTDATASVVMEAVSMLRRAPSRYEVLSMAAQLLQRMPLTDRASAGVTLTVSMRACIPAGVLALASWGVCWLMLRQLACVLCHPVWRLVSCRVPVSLRQQRCQLSLSSDSRGCKHCPLSVQELLPLVEGNLAARSQAVRGVTLRLLCACAQPLVPQQKSSSKDEAPVSGEPQRLSSIFPGLAQIESQVCVHQPNPCLPRIESGVSTQHAMEV